MYSMVCEVSSPASMTPGYSDFSEYENQSSSLVMCFDAPESTYHNSFSFEVFFLIESAFCLIIKVGPNPFPAHSKPST